MFFKPFTGKTEIEHRSNFENIFCYLFMEARHITKSFCKNMIKIPTPNSMLWIAFLYIFSLQVANIFTAHDVQKNTEVYL